MELKSMHYTSAEQKEELAEYKPKAPEYPYGLCLYLNTDTLEKLGVSTLPQDGETFLIQARAVVKGTSSNTSEGETRRSVDLQIVEMALATDVAPADGATMLYGAKD